MDRDRLLRIYLNDHLALATGLVDVAERSLKSNQREPFRSVLEAAHRTALDQHRALLTAMDDLGVERSRLKERTASLMEKAGRLKLNGRLTRYSPLSRVLENEGLSALLELQRSLWAHLEELGERDPRIDRKECSRLAKDCESSIDALRASRAAAVQEAFGT